MTSITIKKKPVIRKIRDLLTNGLITEDMVNDLQQVAEKFSIALTPDIQDLLDRSDLENDPIARQFIPDRQELLYQENEIADPDFQHTKVKGVVHRYPDRCLLKPVNICPIYCRFCFRRQIIGPGTEALSQKDLRNAYQYIKNHPEIWEVILTGGDPLILKPKKLAEIIQALVAIDHVEIIRIHTRIPVADPSRIGPEMIQAIKASKPVYVVLHANHPKEFTQTVKDACAQLVAAGIPMLSQSVLLKGVNDNPDTLAELMRCFVRNRIKPYYLHHLDLAKGTSHFRVTIEEGQALVRALWGKVSGLCQPTYVLDIPGGYGKIPIGPCYIQKAENGSEALGGFILEDYQGANHKY
jgi:lysine 2,3-aminomutase